MKVKKVTIRHLKELLPGEPPTDFELPSYADCMSARSLAYYVKNRFPALNIKAFKTKTDIVRNVISIQAVAKD